jgi:hypothetical protein
MAQTEKATGSGESSRHLSPPPGLRQRPLGRASTFAEPTLNRRRSSIFSETLSDARRSIRSSGDDAFPPRRGSGQEVSDADDTSNWHSLPLGLALLPAAGGLLFKDGSAFITDVTLLAIAAVFMNWALRAPWSWYNAARVASAMETPDPTNETPMEEDEDAIDPGPADNAKPSLKPNSNEKKEERTLVQRTAAENELRVHELLALGKSTPTQNFRRLKPITDSTDKQQ